MSNKRTRSETMADRTSTATKFSVPGLAETIQPTGPAQKMKSGAGKLVPFYTVPFQLPALQVAFDTKPMTPMSGEGRLQCKAALSVDPNDPTQAALKDFMEKVDSQAMKYIDANPKEIFGSKKKPASIADIFVPSIRQSGDYLPLFSAKCAFTGDADEYDLHPSCFFPDGISVDPKEALRAKNKIVAIVKPKYLWVISGRCGVTWSLERACVLEMAADSSAFDFDLTTE